MSDKADSKVSAAFACRAAVGRSSYSPDGMRPTSAASRSRLIASRRASDMSTSGIEVVQPGGVAYGLQLNTRRQHNFVRRNEWHEPSGSRNKVGLRKVFR